ncbi:MAG TPA: glycosyltransferase [Ktedonobacterales bacterium]|jgi:dolichol-phosphate mannosyltransferase|nr:glycosyltransferase [Ktedonobacterales bacterium]
MDTDLLIAPVVAVEAALGARVLMRFVRGAGGASLMPTDRQPRLDERISVLLPVLNEARRIGRCLDGLLAQGPEVGEILVVDGGSTDGTQALVARYQQRDARVRLLDASPVAEGWNGKAWGLERGLRAMAPVCGWALTIDADTVPAPGLARALLAHAVESDEAAFSIATRQEIGGVGEGLLHPTLLTTLVYRFGPPGHAVTRVDQAQANGQCCLFRRDALEAVGGFAAVRASICEDVTIVRLLVSKGAAVGFYEAGDLIRVRMYEGWRETWRNWTRSLPMRDRFFGVAGVVGLLEVTFAQALAPLTLAGLLATWRPITPLRGALLGVTLTLTALRIGTLVGVSRAYVRRPRSFWLSPLSDVPVAIQLWVSALRRRHVWRGRVLLRGEMS